MGTAMSRENDLVNDAESTKQRLNGEGKNDYGKKKSRFILIWFLSSLLNVFIHWLMLISVLNIVSSSDYYHRCSKNKLEGRDIAFLKIK